MGVPTMDQQWLNTYREEIGGFSNTIHSFAQGEIARKDYKGISGGFGSYAQRDAAKHMLRLRLPGGRVTPERLHFMAQAVQQYHVPFLKLTTCEAIQMHDLTPDEVPAIMEAAIPCGIITRGGGGDNPRNIQASPLTGVQPGEAFDVMPWAEAATEYLLSICRDIHMPRKLKVAFCNGVDDCVHTAFRDMGFVAQPDGTFKLYIAGGLGGGWRMGILAAESLPAEDVLYYIRGMITTFCQHGNYQNRARARTRFMQETLGPDELRRVVKPGGFLLLAVPTPRHLYGMKELLYDAPYENEYRETAYPGFSLVRREAVADTIELTSPALIEALFSMTPYYWKTPPEGCERLRRASSLRTEIGFDFLLYRREADV